MGLFEILNSPLPPLLCFGSITEAAVVASVATMSVRCCFHVDVLLVVLEVKKRKEMEIMAWRKLFRSRWIGVMMMIRLIGGLRFSFRSSMRI
uniref:Uncharacterized protein n=1 Tax=Cucumis sativus TaxID=3659 RepID=A0A0A0KR56_CUCSA